jgi:peptide/nickel transport system substrate-binding protein
MGMGKLFGGSRTLTAAALTVAFLAVAAASVRQLRPHAPAGDSAVNDTLFASLRAEPRSFNRYVARDLSTSVLTFLMHDSLVRINRVTSEIEPALAERWELLPDGRTYRLHLRGGVRFSDGTPFSAEDVAFSFRAIYDPSVNSSLAETLQVHGQPLTVAVEDPLTLTIQFPAAFTPGLRMLDGVPIYPRHRLEPSLNGGTFRSAWGVSTPPADLAGLGPFMLRRYDSGQHLTLDRNPHYWRRHGDRPRLAHIVLEIVPDQNAELLRLETGSIDLTQSELRPSDIRALQRATRVQMRMTDAGVGLDGDLFWINLTPAKRRDPRSAWLQHPDFRRALAHAIDRQMFADVVYLGAASPADSIISPGNRQWHVPAPAPGYDVTRAKELLDLLGLSSTGGESTLRDRGHRPVRFTLLTQKGNTSLERGAEVLRDSLARVGVEVDVVTLEAAALIDFIQRGEYDAAYFRLLTTDTDPALNLDFWLSSGSAHVWNPEQRTPTTEWESEIDALMERVATMPDQLERRRLFERVQRIMAREVPVLCFAFPHLKVAIASRVIDATPAAFRPPVLWNVDSIAIRPAAPTE